MGLKEIQRRKFQFALIALVVALISYLVLMINGLGIVAWGVVALTVYVASVLDNFSSRA